MPYTVNPADSSRPLDSDDASLGAAEFRALKARVNQLAGAGTLPVSQTLNQSGLRNLLYPSSDGFWRDIYKSGWKPGFFNQQWGGVNVGFELDDVNTDVPVRFEAPYTQVSIGNTGGNLFPINDIAGRFYQCFPVKVGETQTIQSVWLKLIKTGNPTGNLTVRLIADSGGTIPASNVPITNGTSNAVSSRIITSRTQGDWYRFVFSIPPSLTANTQYWIVVGISTATDASNYISNCGNLIAQSDHPFANKAATGTSAGVFTANTISIAPVLLETVVANQFFQTSLGYFNSALRFNESSPINQSKVINQPMVNFFDGREFTALHRISNGVKGKPFADYIYGIDNNRIQLTCQAVTGVTQVTLYDTNGTATTVNGSTDLTTGSLSDVAIYIRMVGDGADFIQLWVNGIMEASTTLATYLMDRGFKDLGTAWLGGGFPLTPAWTQTLNMTILPSADGWTWTGAATEGLAMAVNNGKLYQSKNGYGSAQDGSYTKTAAALSNANGWIVRAKLHVQSCTNTNIVGAAGSSVALEIFDGTKVLVVRCNEYFISAYSGITNDYYAQADLSIVENEILIIGKGSDYYIFMNGRIIIDGTNALTATSASNQIVFGDINNTAGENADVIWDVVSYYNTAAVLPQISTNCLLHEYGYWSGNKTMLLSTLYNTGIPYSIKSLTGSANNYAQEIPYYEYKRGIIATPSVGAASYTYIRDINTFSLGDNFRVSSSASGLDSGGAATFSYSLSENGKTVSSGQATTGAANFLVLLASIDRKSKNYFGLHNIVPVYQAGGSSILSGAYQRYFSIRSDIP